MGPKVANRGESSVNNPGKLDELARLLNELDAWSHNGNLYSPHGKVIVVTEPVESDRLVRWEVRK